MIWLGSMRCWNEEKHHLTLADISTKMVILHIRIFVCDSLLQPDAYYPDYHSHVAELYKCSTLALITSLLIFLNRTDSSLTLSTEKVALLQLSRITLLGSFQRPRHPQDAFGSPHNARCHHSLHWLSSTIISNTFYQSLEPLRV